MSDDLNALINEVRLLNNQLVELVEDMHRDSGIGASQRAVLEFVQREGPSTVPTIARARGVTRQHIQTISNDLRSADLIELQDNPAHRRSPMLTLTDRGIRTVASMLDREREYLELHGAELDGHAVRSAAHTLAAIRSALAGDAR